MPSAKFVSPANGGTVAANAAFDVQLALQGFETGNFVNAKENYFAAPQQLNAQGQIIGHTHVVIEKLTSLAQTTPTNPLNFAFFKVNNLGFWMDFGSHSKCIGRRSGCYQWSGNGVCSCAWDPRRRVSYVHH